MRSGLALATVLALLGSSCMQGVPPPPPASPSPVGPVPPVATAASCPAPRPPTYLPWGTLTPFALTTGPVSVLRSDGIPAFFVLERRGDTTGAPTSVTEAPSQIMGRQTYLLWSGQPGASEISAWWEEGTGDCHVYHARLSLSGEPEAVRTQFAKIIASIPAALIDPSAGRTGLVAEIPLEHVPASIAVMPDEGRLFVADREGGLSSFDTATNTLLNRVVLPLTDRVPPRITAVPFTKRVYVTDFGGDRVLVIDGSTLAIVTTVLTGRAPIAIASDAKANRVYVAGLGFQSARASDSVPGSVTIIDGNTNAALATVPTHGHPVTLDVHPTIGRLYVGALGLPGESSFLQVIDTRTSTEVATVGVSPPTLLVVDPVDNAVYALSSSPASPFGSKWIELDPRTNAAPTFFDGPGDARAVGWHPGSDGRYRRIYVATHTELGGVLHIFRFLAFPNTLRLGEVGVVRVGTEPVGIAVDGATHRVYVASAGTKTISVVLQGPG
jgi:YVTN family beta-propeller protein